MFFNAPTTFVLIVVGAAGVLTTVGLPLLWTVFAVTLVATTAVAINRSIPRKER